ncbi:MAG: HAMP domain-containing sensor histidine kinase [Rikenellaceae bacterium]
MDSTNSKKVDRKEIGQGQIFVTLLILLWGLILTFVGYQYSRERQYRIEILDSSLQQLNLHLADELDVVGSPEDLYLLNAERFEGLRITLMDTSGLVFYDSHHKDEEECSKIGNIEIQDALKSGRGFRINAIPEGDKSDYIYSATYCDSLIVRSALPYHMSISEVLSSGNTFLFIAIMISSLISMIGYITSKLYSKLKQTTIDLDREHTLKEREEQEKIRIKRQLTNNINHELKTPICSILGYLDMIINNPHLTQDQIITFVGKSYDQAERLRQLMSDLATITRIDEASEMIECESVNITRLVEDIIDDVCPQAVAQSVDVVSSLPDDVVIEGNSSLLYSIFRNLIDNAIAYSGGRRVWIELMNEDAEGYEFVVRDNGIGIEAKHLDYIFERFYRVDKGRSRKVGGTGLGLSIVKNGVVFHGGVISARIAQRGGAEFYFSMKKNR